MNQLDYIHSQLHLLDSNLYQGLHYTTDYLSQCQ